MTGEEPAQPRTMRSEGGHTFLFADLAGFTALTEAHGDERAAELIAEFVECVGDALVGEDAELIKEIGDAVMVRCAEAARAVELGLRIADEVRSRPDFPMVRVGMHTGGAVERSGDWIGANVNLAARVAGSAGGDEVVLTEATREAAGPLDGVEIRPRGQESFRHVLEPVRVFLAMRAGDRPEGGVVDPVCRMTVTPDRAVGRLAWEGRSFHFCSLECARAFASAPERYV